MVCTEILEIQFPLHFHVKTFCVILKQFTESAEAMMQNEYICTCEYTLLVYNTNHIIKLETYEIYIHNNDNITISTWAMPKVKVFVGYF